MVNDLLIIQQLYNSNGKIISARTNIQYLQKHGLYDYIINRYADSESIKESIYRIKNNIEIRPTCKICGNHINFSNYGFATYCSKICQNNDPVVLAKNKASVSKSLLKAYKERGDSIKNKRAETIKQHYGIYTNTPFTIHAIQEKAINTIKEKYGVFNIFALKDYHRTREEMQQDSINYQKKQGYNIEYINDTKPLHIKIINGCPIHGDIVMEWSLFNNRTRLSRRNYTILCPICNPKKAIETSIETIIKNILEKYQINFIQHDRLQIKPKELDFFLPDYNIAIECNGSYWHQGIDAYNRHIEKYNKCKSKNIQLLFYWSYQIYNERNKVEHDILMHLNKVNTIKIIPYNNLTNNINLYNEYTYSISDIDNLKNYCQLHNLHNINLLINIERCHHNILARYSKNIVEKCKPFFINFRAEKIINYNDMNVDIKNLNTLGISLCYNLGYVKIKLI